ncbi:ethanolamine ammonia-lyase reactivating factor EutA [Klebsiella variicola subsp. variicola]|nr:ethanolamine ammonia-lyase reactivating factor EutA [Klebsiella variicola subsp. variicola]
MATALHEHPRLREMNVQFRRKTVRATVIGAGAHTLSPVREHHLAGEGSTAAAQSGRCAIPQEAADLPNAWRQALTQLDLAPRRTLTCWRFPLHFRCATPPY